MDNKLSELSKPVAEIKCHEDLSLSVINVRSGFGIGRHAVYSQEYVSALIDENSAAKIVGVKDFAAEMLARADDSDNSLPDDVRAGMRTAAAFANMFIELREISHG